ncbi:MAG: inorganic phosphate transporter [Candidatus Hadarchaeales archaeon]
MLVSLVFGLGLLLSFYIAWCLGANDAANPCNCVVGAGVYSTKKALITFAIFSAIGGIAFGPFVMKTIDRGLIRRSELETSSLVLASLCAALAGGLWITLSTWRGMPVSTTHSIIGGVLGASLVAGASVNRWVLIRTLLSIPLSPLTAMGLSALLFLLLERYFVSQRGRLSGSLLTVGLYLPIFLIAYFSLFFGIWKLPPSISLWATFLCSFLTMVAVLVWTGGVVGLQLAGNLLILVHFLSAFAFGANDMANATGVFVTPAERLIGIPSLSTMLLLSIMGAAGIALGGLTWGYRVLYTCAYGVTKLDPVTGLAAEYAQALNVLVFTTVPHWLWGFGIPISTSHSNVGTVVGVGLASKGIKGIDKSVLLRILLYWMLTIPSAMLLSGFLYWLMSRVLL